MSGIIIARTAPATGGEQSRDMIATLIANTYVLARLIEEGVDRKRIRRFFNKPKFRRARNNGSWTRMPGPGEHWRCVLIGKGFDLTAVPLDDPGLNDRANIDSLTLVDTLPWPKTVASDTESENLGIHSETLFHRFDDDLPSVGAEILHTIGLRYEAAAEQQRSPSEATKRILADLGRPEPRDPIVFKVVDDVEISLEHRFLKRGYA